MSKKKTWKRESPKLEMLPQLPVPSNETLQDPAALFLHLTRWTVPHGGEDAYYGDMLTAMGFSRDEHGNYSREILGEGDARPTTCFTAHLDCACWTASRIIRKYYKETGMVVTDGATILGADDRAGLTVLLNMCYWEVPGLYYLFAGEEKGCIGSALLASSEKFPDHIKKMVSFDRRGTESVITHQCSARTCSDAFAEELCGRMNELGKSFLLKMAPDDTGVYTDSNEFRAIIPECTNISVGYEHAHSTHEEQDTDFLTVLCWLCRLIDWETLPVERVPVLEVDDDRYGFEGWPRHWCGGTYTGSLEDHVGKGYIDDDAMYEGSYTSDDDAFAAVENIVTAVQYGTAIDDNWINAIATVGTTADIATMIGILLQDLRTKCF